MSNVLSDAEIEAAEKRCGDEVRNLLHPDRTLSDVLRSLTSNSDLVRIAATCGVSVDRVRALAWLLLIRQQIAEE